MLSARILTTVILVPLLLAALFKLPPTLLALVFGIIILLAAWEWSGLCWPGRVARRMGFVALVAASCLVLYLVSSAARWVPWLAVAWWLWVLRELWAYEQGDSTMSTSSTRAIAAGWATLVPAWLAVVVLAELAPRPWLLLSLLLVIWTADIAAYFTGRACGRRRLAPRLSPGKSLEGLYGGFTAALLVGLATGLGALDLDPANLLPWLLLCSVAILFSVAGDLYESLQKRRAGVKDSGGLLPGHGGVLDRIDSLTAAAPVFLAGWSLLTGGL